MKDQGFENLLAREFAKPLQEEPATDLVLRVLARADGTRRMQRFVVTGAVGVGVAGAAGIVTTFASLDAVAREFADLFAALPGAGLAPVAMLCLALTVAVGIRSRVA